MTLMTIVGEQWRRAAIWKVGSVSCATGSIIVIMSLSSLSPSSCLPHHHHHHPSHHIPVDHPHCSGRASCWSWLVGRWNPPGRLHHWLGSPPLGNQPLPPQATSRHLHLDLLHLLGHPLLEDLGSVGQHDVANRMCFESGAFLRGGFSSQK